MSSELLVRRFAEIGAQLDVELGPWRGAPRLDVRDERIQLGFTGRGEPADAEVVQVAPADRHLLRTAKAALQPPAVRRSRRGCRRGSAFAAATRRSCARVSGSSCPSTESRAQAMRHVIFID